MFHVQLDRDEEDDLAEVAERERFSLGYQCPRCRKAAFYLPGEPGDYFAGKKLEFLKPISCIWCRMPFTTGQLYLRNLGLFHVLTGALAPGESEAA